MKAILDSWVIPRMGVRQLRASALVGNIGSRKVLEKCGFVNVGETTVEVQGEKRGLWIFERK